ncbi:hypothetical protein KJ684_02965 [Patescibacteria group bacterium]|nr:hypothetical protein [Patescibacteria group bacterium]
METIITIILGILFLIVAVKFLKTPIEKERRIKKIFIIMAILFFFSFLL